MSEHYILGGKDGRTPVPTDLMTWAKALKKVRHVAVAELSDGVRISTVFLGLDHSFGDGPPLLFETMIFNGPHDGYCERCSTWEQAEEQHAQALKVARGDR